MTANIKKYHIRIKKKLNKLKSLPKCLNFPQVVAYQPKHSGKVNYYMPNKL